MGKSLVLPKVTKNTDYRGFIDETLLLNNITRKEFCKSFSEYCNYGSLGPVLAKASDGSYRESGKSMNNHNLASLLAAMGLSKAGIRLILFSKMSAEAEVLPIKHGSEFKKLLSNVLSSSNTAKVIGIKSYTIEDVLQMLDKRAAKRVLKSIVEEVEDSRSPRLKDNNDLRDHLVDELKTKSKSL